MTNMPPAALTTRRGERIPVRLLSSGDVSALQRFNANLSPATRSVFTPHPYDEAAILRLAQRTAEGLDRIYVALAGEEIIGYFFIRYLRDRAPRLGIGIADAYQGQGLGEQMMTVLIGEARAAGCEGIDLTTVRGNVRARRLYEKMGFRYVYDVGNGGDVVEHRLFLALKPGAQPEDRPFWPRVGSLATAQRSEHG
jgi:ribosomal protein S18 acetylase RimI-like enzyme